MCFFFVDMKKTLTLLSAPIFASTISHNVNAVDFNDKVYGKMSFSFGYAYQKDSSKGIEEASSGLNGVEKDYQHIILGAGYSFYYKSCDTIHPFVGLDIEGRVPVKTYIDKQDWRGQNAKDYWKINDFLSVHLKLGAKFVLSKIL